MDSVAVPFENTLSALRGNSVRAGWWLAGSGAVIVVVWLVVAVTIAVPVTVSSIDGRIVSATDPMDITSTSHEPIVALALRLGDPVAANDVLVAFDSQPLQLELQGSEQRAVKLEQELAAIEQEMNATNQALLNELDSYDRAQERLQARMGESRAQLEHAITAERLYGEFRSERRIDALKYSQARADLERSRMTLQAQQAESDELLANRSLAANRSETSQAQLARERARLKGELAELQPQMQSQIAQIDELTIRAPFAGAIGAIARATIGQSLPPGEWLMTLVPTQEFEFQASFAAREAAGRLFAGQRARIRFHALPWTEYGTMDAVVLRVGNEERAGAVRVDFTLDLNSSLTTYLGHGLKGQVVVQIDEATLAQRMLRLLSSSGR
jgi:multidrug resistance efflux pump